MDTRRRYGRSDVKASRVSAIANIRAPNGISSPLSRRGSPSAIYVFGRKDQRLNAACILDNERRISSFSVVKGRGIIEAGVREIYPSPVEFVFQLLASGHNPTYLIRRWRLNYNCVPTPHAPLARAPRASGFKSVQNGEGAFCRRYTPTLLPFAPSAAPHLYLRFAFGHLFHSGARDFRCRNVHFSPTSASALKSTGSVPA